MIQIYNDISAVVGTRMRTACGVIQESTRG